MKSTPQETVRPLIYGHRGSAVLAPENTREAFNLALLLGADVLETDVRSSRDGIPVIHHDAKLDRTTNGNGFVSNYSLEELKQLDAGYHFQSPSGKRFRGEGVRMITLKEMLEEYPDTPINIEIKHPKTEFARTVANVINDSGREHSVTVASFHGGVTEAFRNAAPQINTAATKDEIVQQYYRQFLPGHLWKRMFRNNQASPENRATTEPRSSGLAYSTLQIPTKFKKSLFTLDLSNSDFIAYLHDQSLSVTFWTINDIEAMVTLANNGADGIVTDRPDLAARIFEL